MYLGSLDRATPFKDTSVALNTAFNAGMFEGFRLPNFSAGEVTELTKICQKNSLVKSTVHQGQYNASCRDGEQELLPALRTNHIPFYAYSESAGSFQYF